MGILVFFSTHSRQGDKVVGINTHINVLSFTHSQQGDMVVGINTHINMF